MGGGGSEGEVFQSQDDENISANFPVKFSSSRLTDREKYLLKKCWHLKKELRCCCYRIPGKASYI